MGGLTQALATASGPEAIRSHGKEVPNPKQFSLFLLLEQ